jgi:hypothetical protein
VICSRYGQAVLVFDAVPIHSGRSISGTEVEEWLRSVKLGRYAPAFAERKINALSQLQAMSLEAVREMDMKILEERCDKHTP